MLTITINPSGAAFEEDAVHEVARIINRAQGRIVDRTVAPGTGPYPLMDSNGNSCGAVEWVIGPPVRHEHDADAVNHYAHDPKALREHMREEHGWNSEHPFDATLLDDHGNNVREHLAEHYQWHVDEAGN